MRNLKHTTRILSLYLALSLVVLPYGPQIAFAEGEESLISPIAETSVSPATTTEDASSTSSTSSSESETAEESVGNSASASTTETVENSSSESTTTLDELSIDLTLSGATTTPSGSDTVVESASSTSDAPQSGFETTAAAPSTNDQTGRSNESASTTLSVASSSQTIVTGEATAFANILNMLNASFINSEGAILFANLMNASGTLDLRGENPFAGICDGGSCTGLSDVQVNLLQNALILNDILVTAGTGGNSIDHASSSAAIESGAAYAGLNLVNLANLTLIASSYLIATMNAFGDVNGDIVLPGLIRFLQGGAGNGGSVSMANGTTITNDANAAATSGDNELLYVDGESAVITGDAAARVNVFNHINSLLSSGVSVLLRTGGSWVGEIQGLVPGVQLLALPDGVLITANGWGITGSPLLVGLNSTSTVEIANRAAVIAQTGRNTITNASSTALISTGDAYAGANIINLANQTIIGKNWLLAIINIFGNFNGNLAFGRPNLWVGDTVSAPGFIENGTELGYTITVINNGDAPASNVRVIENYDEAHLTIGTASEEFTENSGTLTFALGTMAPGETREILYSATVHNAAPGTSITQTSAARSHETDNDVSDNTDQTVITVSMPPSSGGIIYTPTPLPTPATTPPAVPTATEITPRDDVLTALESAWATLSVTRITPAVASEVGHSVTETLTVKNTGAHVAYAVVLFDQLLNPNQETVHEEVFEIGDIAIGEEVQIEYSMHFDQDAALGEYEIQSRIVGGNVEESTHAPGTIALSGMLPGIPVAGEMSDALALVEVAAHQIPVDSAPVLTGADTEVGPGTSRYSQLAASGVIEMNIAMQIFLFLSIVLMAAHVGHRKLLLTHDDTL